MADSTTNDGVPDSTAPETGSIAARIAEIDAVLATGAASVTVDGTTTAYSMKDLRAERQELQKQLQTGGSRRRPYVMRPRMG